MKVLIVILLVIVLLILLSPYLLKWAVKGMARRFQRIVEGADQDNPSAYDASDPKQRKRHEKTVREVNKIFDDDEGSYVDFKEEKRQ